MEADSYFRQLAQVRPNKQKFAPAPVVKKVPLLPCEVKGEKVFTVGQATTLQCLLEESFDSKTSFQFQDLGEANHSIKFLEAPVLKDKVLEQALTGYKVGRHQFDKVVLKINDKTFPVTLFEYEIKTVITQPSPTPFPTIDPHELSAPWWWWTIWGALFIGIVATCVVQFIKYRKRKLLELANAPKIKIYTPFERFKLNLQKLESQEFHLKGEYKRFALDLSAIAKKAVGEKLKFPAEDMTTEEFIETLQKDHKAFWKDAEVQINYSFQELDKIKFAKTPATSEMCMKLLDSVRHIGDILYRGEQ